MLRGCRVHTTLPVTDVARARGFYAEKPGLTPTEEFRPGSSTSAERARGSYSHRWPRNQPATRGWRSL